MIANSEVDEGDPCPIEGCDGKMYFLKSENCTCHINPPCGSCTSVQLTCSECRWENGQPEKYVPPSVPQEWKKWYRDNSPPYEKNLGDGKRLYDYNYDGRSGSTMVFTGKYEGPVTYADIIEALGDGTFGHRGPEMYSSGKGINRGRFEYTKITD